MQGAMGAPQKVEEDVEPRGEYVVGMGEFSSSSGLSMRKMHAISRLEMVEAAWRERTRGWNPSIERVLFPEGSGANGNGRTSRRI